jgi:hypothetical protein
LHQVRISTTIRPRIRLLITPLAAALLVCGLAAPVSAAAAQAATRPSVPSKWTADHGDTTNGIACPTIHLCVGVDSNAVTWTTDPTARKPKWKHVALEPSSQPTVTSSGVILDAISCASARFCLIADDLGNTFATTNPTGGKKAWHEAAADQIEVLGLSCSSTLLCAGVDYYGNALISTDPDAAQPTWKSTFLATNNDEDPPVVSCVGRSECVAVEATSSIFATTDATAAVPKWTHVRVAGRGGWDAVSCPSTSRCVAVGAIDEDSRVAVTDNLAGGKRTWKATKVHNGAGGSLADVDCATKSFCFAIGNVYSTHAAAKASAWHSVAPPSSSSETDVSCASTTWCFVATIAGTEAWHR